MSLKKKQKLVFWGFCGYLGEMNRKNIYTYVYFAFLFRVLMSFFAKSGGATALGLIIRFFGWPSSYTHSTYSFCIEKCAHQHMWRVLQG